MDVILMVPEPQEQDLVTGWGITSQKQLSIVLVVHKYISHNALLAAGNRVVLLLRGYGTARRIQGKNSMIARQVLQGLDEQAAKFNFPVLDNAYIKFAAARLSVFCSPRDWLIVFEVLGFSEREVQFVDDLYAFGSCIDKQGFVGEGIPITSSQDEPLFDQETNECVANWDHWAVVVGTEKMSFVPTLKEYEEAGIDISRMPGKGTLSEAEILRFLVYRLPESRLFMSDERLLSQFRECKKLPRCIQTAKWQHPDVADEEKPSENICMRSLVNAIVANDPSLFNPGTPNTHWKFWVESHQSD